MTVVDLAYVLHHVAHAAGSSFRALKNRPDNFSTVRDGADGAPTTKLDDGLETACLVALRNLKVSGTVLSEESGEIALTHSGKELFVLDPLDGTTNAAMGFPYFALSIAVLDDIGTAAALVYNYCTEDIYFAQRGAGAMHNGRPIRVAPATELRQQQLALSRPLHAAEADTYRAWLLGSKRVRISSCPSLDTALVAAGTFHAYVDFHTPQGLIHTHDVAAAALIVAEAGGLLLDETGEPLRLSRDVTSTYNIFAVNDRSTFQALTRDIGSQGPMQALAGARS